jgi:hypothetical protein
MMTRGTPPRPVDDEVVTIARRYKVEAAATLVTVCRDEHAPASARAQAATKLLEYAEGRPAQSRQIAVADIGAMSDQERLALLRALLVHFDREQPGFLRQLMADAYIDAAQQLGLPKPNRFTRGTPPTLIAQPESRQSVRSSLKNTNSHSGVRERGDAHEGHAPAVVGDAPEVPRHRATGDVQPLPLGTHPVIPQPELEPINDRPVNGHSVHPDVVTRSALPNPGMAMDLAFRGYGYPWRRS